ncbi:MAG: hypothetical protein AAFQ60_18335, partial [Pseudomonadota bacterium]
AFARTQADYTLLEVGLGGRLDATNVIDTPRLTIITPVSMDHEAFLGDTLAKIAGEKAGIIKRRVPVIVGPQEDEAMDVIEAQAPRGNFVLEEGTGRPIVMISAGVGITPMLAMVESLLVHEGRNRHTAALRLIHGARDGETLAFGAWLRAKAAAHPGFTPTIALSAPGPGDVLGETHDHEGRI